MKKINKTAKICFALMLIFSMTFATTVINADEPAAETPVAETPVAETPATETTATETPAADAPAAEGAEGEKTDAAAAIQLPAPSFELVAETEKVALYADKTLGEIKFVDKVNNVDWYSNPQDKTTDSASAEKRERLYSQFTMEYSQAYNPLATSSSASCLKFTRPAVKPSLSTKALNRLAGFKDDAGCEEIKLGDCLDSEPVKNGIKFIYKMPGLGFKVVIQHVINDDYLESSILMDESILQAINMEKQVVGGFQTRITEIDYNVTRIDLLPMFGTGRMGEQGSMFLPDESGVIVNYDNGKENYEDYDMPVYGRYYETKEYAKRSNGVYMPVFGTIKPSGTLMGVITDGAPAGFIRAFVSGKDTNFNSAYSSAQVCVIEKNVGETEGIPYAKSLFGGSNYSVRYYSLGADNGGYVGMANRYRQYLVEEKGMKKNEKTDSSLFLDVYGQVNKDKNILGVPVEMPESLTTYNELVDMVETLKKAGADIPTVRYTNWQSEKNDGTVAESVKFSSYLGGKGDFKDLVKYMKENNVSFYPNVDYVNFAEGTMKYSKFANSIKKLDQSPVTVIRNRVPIKLGNKWYLLKPSTLKKGLDNFTKDYAKYKIGGIAIDSIGSMVYSDYSKGSDVRVSTAKVWEDVFKNTKKNAGDLMVGEANAYVFPYANAILTTPSTDAYCEIANYTVPFYQMVLHGYVNYGTEAVNLSATPEIIRLKGIETGAALTYSIFASPASDVKDTYMDYLFSSNFELVKERMLKYNLADKYYYDMIKGQQIVNHEILQENVTRTTFENGVKVVVNYNNESAKVGGTVVEGLTYRIQR